MSQLDRRAFRKLVMELRRRDKRTVTELEAALGQQDPPWIGDLGKPLYQNNRAWSPTLLDALDRAFGQRLGGYPARALARAHDSADLTELEEYLYPPAAQDQAPSAAMPAEDDSDAAAELERAAPTQRSWLGGLGFVIMLALVGVLAFSMLSRPDGSSMAPVDGVVRCRSGAPVVGIWIAWDSSAGMFAGIHPGGTSTGFTGRVPPGKAYRLHVGCGGTAEAWLVTAYSEPMTVRESSHICDDTVAATSAPPFVGRCRQ